jgi:hypothetical protein
VVGTLFGGWQPRGIGLQTGVTAAVGGTAVGTAYAFYKLYRFSPLLFLVAMVGLSALAASIPRATYGERLNDIKVGFYWLDQALFTPHRHAEQLLRIQLPPFPAWDELVGATTRDAALGRACLHGLTRSRTTPALASQIAKRLPELAIGQTPARIGTALRCFPAFFEVTSRQWQVGRPIGF